MSLTWLRTALPRAWTARGPVAWALLPVAAITGIVVALRKIGYAWGVFPVRQLPPDVVVVVVGNPVAGGAGKTPTVIALATHLRNRGVLVGVVSRGYGRRNLQCLRVHRHSKPDDVGDEPLLIHRRTDVPVAVCANRSQAADLLLQECPTLQVLLCDDGLQHYALHRDVEIVLLDRRGLGNGWLMPAGPLREPWPGPLVVRAGQRLDRRLVLHTGSPAGAGAFSARRTLEDTARGQDGAEVALTSLRHGPPILALAAIAQPDEFFGQLRERGLVLAKTLPLPDHYTFDSNTLNCYEGYRIICTEKDAPKLWPFAPHALAVALRFEPEPAFFTAFDRLLAAARAETL